MKRRRFRRSFRRKAKTFWVDTFQDAVPIKMDIFPGFDPDPTHNKVLVVPLIRQRQPQAVEDISSVLEGKNEGFRLRRIVGDLLFMAGTAEISSQEDRPVRIDFYIRWGIMVHPITAQRNFGNFTNQEYVFNPTESVSMSDPWLICRSLMLSNFGPFDLNQVNLGVNNSLRDNNQIHSAGPGTTVDINVNRRVGPEEDVSLFLCWNSTWSPTGGDTLIEPYYQSNLRMLISK